MKPSKKIAKRLQKRIDGFAAITGAPGSRPSSVKVNRHEFHKPGSRKKVQ